MSAKDLLRIDEGRIIVPAARIRSHTQTEYIYDIYQNSSYDGHKAEDNKDERRINGRGRPGHRHFWKLPASLFLVADLSVAVTAFTFDLSELCLNGFGILFCSCR